MPPPLPRTDPATVVGPEVGGAPCGRGAVRERAICDAALELLVEVGYDRMTMDQVAARARASKATIYRRWPGKRELVHEAMRSRSEHLIEPPDTGTLRGDLLAAFRLVGDKIGSEDVALMSGVMRAMRSAPELGDCMREQVLEGKRRIARTIVDRAVARGEVPPDTDADLLHEVSAALITFRLLVVGAPADDAYLEHVIDDVLVPLFTRG